jgi:lysyl-tRNA synthetase class II
VEGKMNINEMIIESVNKIESEGLIQKMLDEQIKQTLSKAVSNLFGNYSDFSKDLENQLKGTLKVDLSRISLECHTQFILNKIEENINQYYKNDATAKVQERIKKIFKPIEKTEWKLSEIMEKFEETVIEGDEEYRGCEFTFITEEADTLYCKGYRRAYFDKEPNKGK